MSESTPQFHKYWNQIWSFSVIMVLITVVFTFRPFVIFSLKKKKSPKSIPRCKHFIFMDKENFTGKFSDCSILLPKIILGLWNLFIYSFIFFTDTSHIHLEIYKSMLFIQKFNKDWIQNPVEGNLKKDSLFSVVHWIKYWSLC